MSFKKSDVYECKVSYSKEDVSIFAKLTGDSNPLHLDEEFAAKSIFGKLIVPGFLSGAIFSKVFGTIFPGIGTIYLYQEMKFIRPVFIDEIYSAKFIVSEIISKKNRAKILCLLVNSKGEICIEGNALIKNINKIK